MGPEAPQLVVAYGGDRLQAELQAGGTTLWSGGWNPTLTLDGRRAEFSSPWREVCWVSDDDGDYLELEVHLAGGWTVQRQMLLAREDRFLYLADALVGPREAAVDYRLTLPLAGYTSFQPADATREGYLVGDGPEALVLPLALPEWRTAAAAGALQAVDQGLELRGRAPRPGCICRCCWMWTAGGWAGHSPGGS